MTGDQRRTTNLALPVLLGLVAGLAGGIVVSMTDHPWVQATVSVIEPMGTIWVNAIRMTVIPIVVSVVVTGITAAGASSAGGIGGRALLLFATLVTGSALFGLLTAPPLIGRLAIDPAIAQTARASLPAAPPAEPPPFRDWLTGLIPSNPVRAAADDAVLPLVVFTTLLALGLTRLAPQRRDPVVQLVTSIREAMFVVVRGILLVAPIGVFGLVLPLAARHGLEFAGAIGGFVLVVSALVVIATLALYPVVQLWGGVPMRRFALACAPAQAVAFSTRSSLASLPALLEGAERRLGLSHEVAGLVLSGGVAVFKFAAPIVRMAGAVLVARLYGVSLGGLELVALGGALALLSFYSPGIPSGGLLVLAPVFLAFGLPMEGIGLLIAIDLIPDMFVTVSNVTADMAVAVLVAGKRTDRPW